MLDKICDIQRFANVFCLVLKYTKKSIYSEKTAALGGQANQNE